MRGAEKSLPRDTPALLNPCRGATLQKSMGRLTITT